MTTKTTYVSKEEKEILIELIQPHLEIIRSTAKDTPTCIKKAEVWKQIAKQFNQSEMKKCERPPDKLKTIWKNMASEAKTRASEFKQQSRKTGGGPAPIELDPHSQKVLDSLGQNVLPLHNEHDNDREQHGTDVIVCSTSKPDESDSTPSKKNRGNYMIGRRSRNFSPGVTAPKFSIGIQEAIKQRTKEHQMKQDEHELKMEILQMKKIYWETRLQREFGNQGITITTPVVLDTDCDPMISFANEIN